MNTSRNDAGASRSSPGGPAIAPLQPVTSRCQSGGCPTVYLSGAGTLVVQGYAVSADRAGVDLPDGETLVEIPLDLLTEAVRNLAAPG